MGLFRLFRNLTVVFLLANYYNYFMRKFIILSVILISINNFSFANIIDDIETERINCLNTNYQSDYEMSQCNYKAINAYNYEITKELKLLKKLLSKSQSKLLSDTNSNWETYIKNDNFLLENLLEHEKYAEPYLISSGIKCQNKKHYLEELITIYQYLKETKN